MSEMGESRVGRWKKERVETEGKGGANEKEAQGMATKGKPRQQRPGRGEKGPPDQSASKTFIEWVTRSTMEPSGSIGML